MPSALGIIPVGIIAAVELYFVWKQQVVLVPLVGTRVSKGANPIWFWIWATSWVALLLSAVYTLVIS